MTWNIKKDEEEAIFRKRLLYDGHGFGEDKRLINLTKMVAKLCLTAPESEEELTKTIGIISKDLAAATISAEKHDKQISMFERTFAGYQESLESRKKDCENIKADIARLELDLEYIERLKQVEKYLNCETTSNLIAEMKETKRQLFEKLDKNRRTVASLIEACRNLQNLLEQQEEQTGFTF